MEATSLAPFGNGAPKVPLVHPSGSFPNRGPPPAFPPLAPDPGVLGGGWGAGFLGLRVGSLFSAGLGFMQASMMFCETEGFCLIC